MLLQESSCSSLLHDERINVLLNFYLVQHCNWTETIENNKAGKPHKSTRWVCWLNEAHSESFRIACSDFCYVCWEINIKFSLLIQCMFSLIKQFRKGRHWYCYLKYSSLLDVTKHYYVFKYLGERGLYESKIKNLNCL